MKRIIEIAICLFLFTSTSYAGVKTTQDTISISGAHLAILKDTSASNFTKRELDSIKVTHYKPNPAKVIWMAAIIPGYGQIMNHSYWKLPIVYAGFLGCAYAITWNSYHYNTFKRAYQDISDNNPNTTSYLNLLPAGYTVSNYPGGLSGLETNLKSLYENFRRYRDLSIIVSVGYYALTIAEAYVEAQLFDFDISPDLSLGVSPAVMQNNFGVPNSAGLQLSFNIK